MGHGAAPHASCDSRADGAVAAHRRGAAVTEWLFVRRPDAGSCCTSHARDAAGLAAGAGCLRRTKRKCVQLRLPPRASFTASP